MRVLVIEPGEQLTPLLQEAGHHVAMTADVSEVLSENPAAYDAIVFDGSSFLDALQNCARLTEVYSRVPILLIVGPDEPETRVAALDAGAADSLSVPYVFAELQARLRALTRRAEATEALVEQARDSGPGRAGP